MKRMLSIILLVITLSTILTVKGFVVADTTTKTYTTATIEYKEIKALKVTYKQLEEYGSEIVTNYIALTEVEEVEGFEGYYKTNKFMTSYKDATLTSENGFVLSYGWIWDIEEVTTLVKEVETTTNNVEVNNNVTVINVEYNQVNATLPEFNFMTIYDTYRVNTEVINNYESIILVGSRLNRNREYRSQAVEGG